LCDEPLSGLDSITKYSVLNDFKTTVRDLNLAVLWVTHDLYEAKTISDQLLLLKNNGIETLNRNVNEKYFRKILDC
jgi:ABC-type nitrate/sulfonate/bicarbonate transport system ATPase subunit